MKNNEKIWRFLKVALIVGGILVTIGIAYGVLNNQVQGNTTTIEKHEVKLDGHQIALIILRNCVRKSRSLVLHDALPIPWHIEAV